MVKSTYDAGYFVSRCANAVESMRRYGMNEHIISLVISEIRSFAVSEEFLRIQEMIRATPPHHTHLDEIHAALPSVRNEDEVS